MSEEFAGTMDDQSHYEISLTAGQAFLAFVLLLLSLAATFAFGLMIGKGQADERLVVRKEPAIIQEGSVLPSKRSSGRIVDLGVSNDDFKAPSHTEAKASVDATPAPTPLIAEDSPALEEKNPSAALPASVQPGNAAPVNATVTPAATAPAPVSAAAPPVKQPEVAKVGVKPPDAAKTTVPAKASPVYAQLLSTGDQKTAEALAARLIDHGFNGAFVERLPGDKGTMYRVRIRYNSENEARVAEPKLREVVKDVWIAK
jgi:hypothetical protein